MYSKKQNKRHHAHPRSAPYGTWSSPITADLAATAGGSFHFPQADGDAVYWIERRPEEEGRMVLVRQEDDGSRIDITPPPYSVRSRVHEYGGRSYVIHRDVVYFVNGADQRIYSIDVNVNQQEGNPSPAAPRAVTPEAPWRFADLVVDVRRSQLLAVREDHSTDADHPLNDLVSIDLGSGQVRPLLSDDHPGVRSDFVAYPRIDAGGQRIAWISWDHPRMPWDGTELWTASLDADGRVDGVQSIAGGPRESIFQPEWSPRGEVYFVSDRSGWWNLYCWDGHRVRAVWEAEVDMGMPLWQLGMATFGFTGKNELVTAYTQRGVWHLARLSTSEGARRGGAAVDSTSASVTPLPGEYAEIQHVSAAGDRVLLLAGTTRAPINVITVSADGGDTRLLSQAATPDISPEYFSIPEPIAFPIDDGGPGHAFYYPPHNPDYTAPPEELPPLRVLSHSGPTSAASASLDLRIQYWTSRGFGVLDVNYRGSTGFGRAYREGLNGQWGVVDVADCVAATKHMVDRGIVDGDRLCIFGSSAGGYTTLAALTFQDVFHAGASRYGISDLEALATDTHKFESRYLDSLVGPYPAAIRRYRDRSPIYSADRLTCPVIFFQGSDDPVVAPDQSGRMVDALKEKGVPVAYLLFDGEGHGFRQATNIRRTLEAELYFYGRIFGFTPADTIDPVLIHNIDGSQGPRG